MFIALELRACTKIFYSDLGKPSPLLLVGRTLEVAISIVTSVTNVRDISFNLSTRVIAFCVTNALNLQCYWLVRALE